MINQTIQTIETPGVWDREQIEKYTQKIAFALSIAGWVYNSERHHAVRTSFNYIISSPTSLKGWENLKKFCNRLARDIKYNSSDVKRQVKSEHKQQIIDILSSITVPSEPVSPGHGSSEGNERMFSFLLCVAQYRQKTYKELMEIICSSDLPQQA